MDKNRRKFLKIVLIGGGTLLVGKVLNPLFSALDDSSAKIGLPEKTAPKAFHVVENKKIFSIYDNSGEEIFQIDKEV